MVSAEIRRAWPCVPWSAVCAGVFLLLLAQWPVAGDTESLVAVPDAASQRAAGKTIDRLFRAEISAARGADEKSALAVKYLAAAAESTDDPAARFVLLSRARDLAADGGNTKTALEAVDQLSTAFTVDRLAAQSEILDRLAKRGVARADLPDLAAHAIAVANEAANGDQYEIARRVSQRAIDLARKAGDPILSANATAVDRRAMLEEPAFHRAERALAILAKDPQNPKANEEAGVFYCFFRGNWERGLPMLARSRDAAVKDLAVQEIGSPTAAAEQLKLADGWWAIAEGRKEPEKGRIRAHAASWYQQSAEGLNGLLKAKAEKRVHEAAGDQPSTLKLASVSFAEDMGYKIATLRPGVMSHSNRDNSVLTVPEALIGRPYTQVIAGPDLGVKIRFDTAGDLFVLSEKFPARPSNAADLLGAMGRKLDGQSFTCSSGTPWEVWVVSGKAGEEFEIPFQVMLVAENLRKIRTK